MALLDPTTGLPLFALGKDCYLRRVTGDVVVEYTWYNDWPVMALYRALPAKKTSVFLIELDDAHLYVDSDGYPTRKLIAHSLQAAQNLGFGLDKYAARRLADVILDGIADLIKMPPAPRAPRAAAPTLGAKMALQVGGQTVREVTL